MLDTAQEELQQFIDTGNMIPDEQKAEKQRENGDRHIRNRTYGGVREGGGNSPSYSLRYIARLASTIEV